MAKDGQRNASGGGEEPAEPDPGSQAEHHERVDMGNGDAGTAAGDSSSGTASASPVGLDDEDDASSGPGPLQPGPATARSVPASDDVSLGDDKVQEMIEAMPTGVRNMFVPGTLTVHYASRSVDYPADGAAAMRLLALLAGTSRDMDPVVADRSDARHGWVMVDRDDVIGAQWTPSAETVPRRVTMDPAGDLVDAR